MSSSTERRPLRIALVAAGGAAAAAVGALAGAPAALQAAIVAVVVAGVCVVAWPVPEPRRGPREQSELFDHMLDAIDAERETLAHCLHDGPQQTLTAVRLMCDVVRDAISKGDVHHAEEVLGRLERLASDAADDLRRTVARLHPVVMQQQGLVQALGSLAETVHEEYGVATSFTRPPGGWEAENDRDTAIFQIAREGGDRLGREVACGLAAEDDPLAAGHGRQHVARPERLPDRLHPLLDHAVVVVKPAPEAAPLDDDPRDAERVARPARIDRGPAGAAFRAGVGRDDVGRLVADHTDHHPAGTCRDTTVRVPGADSSVSSAPIRAARSRIMRIPTPSRGT